MRRTLLVLAMALVAAVAPVSAARAAGGGGFVSVDLVPPGPTFVAPTGLAFGPGGAMTAAWLQGGVAADLMVADRPAGGPWADAERISGGANVTGATLVSNATGAEALSWLEAGYVRAATRAPGGAWSVVAVPLSASGIGTAPVVALAPDGTVAVAWLDGGEVKVSVRGTAGAFSSAATIPSGTSPHALAIAAGPASDIMLAWADTNGAQSRMMTAYRTAGAFSFAAPVAALTVSPGNVNQSIYLNVPKVVFDTAGQVSLVWLRAVMDSGLNQTLTVWESKWRTAGPSGTFQGVIPHSFDNNTVNNTLPAPLYDGELVTDAGGRTTFAWPALGSGGGVGMASRPAPGAGFGASGFVPTPGTPRMSVSAAGSSVLVVDEKALSVAFAPPGGALGTFDAVLSPTAASTQNRTAAAGDDGGDAAVLWSARDATSSAMRVSTWDVTAPEARAVSVPGSAVAGASVGMSVTPWDALTGASAVWDFGDGSPVVSGASVSHSYGSAGTRTVTITVTDGAGNQTVVTRAVAVSPAPAPAAPAPAPATPHPAAPVARITGLKLSPATFRAKTGTKVSYTINIAATVRFTVERCAKPKPTKANKKPKACTKSTKVAGKITRAVKAGPDRFTFKSRHGQIVLKPGSYRLVATPTGSGTPARAFFKIIR